MRTTRHVTPLTLLLCVLYVYAHTALCEELPQPYAYRKDETHGPRWDKETLTRLLAEQETPYNTTVVTYPMATNETNKTEANIESIAFNYKVNFWTSFKGHRVSLSNPINHFSILQPVGGCGGNRQRATVTGKAGQCRVVTNAGFFNTHTGDCLGNLVSDEQIVQDPGTQNVNFGITNDGQYVVGYLNTSEVEYYNFTQLIAGVVWIVRNGSVWVDESAKLEEVSTQETGSMNRFITVKAPRVGLGHDAAGRLMVVQIEGNEGSGSGADLYNLAEVMIGMGAVNAINLDGGGSTTLGLDSIMINYPTDKCDGPLGDLGAKCQRHVTSVTCMHDILVPPTPPPPPPPPPSPPTPTDPLCAAFCLNPTNHNATYLSTDTMCPAWDCGKWYVDSLPPPPPPPEPKPCVCPPCKTSSSSGEDVGTSGGGEGQSNMSGVIGGSVAAVLGLCLIGGAVKWKLSRSSSSGSGSLGGGGRGGSGGVSLPSVRGSRKRGRGYDEVPIMIDVESDSGGDGGGGERESERERGGEREGVSVVEPEDDVLSPVVPGQALPASMETAAE